MTSLADARRRRLKFRAWHRGTKEADLMIGGFLDACLNTLDDDGVAWFEALLEENDVEIMAWAMQRKPAPLRYQGELLERMIRLDYLKIDS